MPNFRCHGGELTMARNNGSGGASISNKKLVLKHTGPEILSMSNAIPDHSFVTLQDTTGPTPSFGYGLTGMLTASGNATGSALFGSAASVPSFGNTTASSPVTTPTTTAPILGISLSPATTASTPLCSFTQSSGSTTTASTTCSLLSFGPSIFSVSASTMPSAAAYVTPQVFGEMPTPRSCPRIYNTSLNYCHGQQTPIQSTCVPDGNSNLSEQNLDGMPQSYVLHNLNRQSVFRANGTERSYFALPEDYPLERTVPEPVFDVYDDELDGCSNEFAQVFTGTPKQQTYEVEQHESRQAPKCFRKQTFSPERPTIGVVGVFSLTNEQHPDNELCGKHVKAQQVNNQQWNMLMTEAERKEWDPGTWKTIIVVPPVVKWSSLEGLKQEINFSPNILLSMIVYAATSFPSILSSFPRSMLWDPEMVHILPMKFGASRAHTFDSAIMCYFAFGLGWTEVNASVLFVLAVQCSIGRSVAKHCLFLSNYGNSRTNHSFPKLFMHSLCTTQVVQVPIQRHTLEYRLMDVISQNGSEFGTGQLTCMPSTINSFELLRQMVNVLSRWLPSFDNRAKLQWDPGITVSLYMHIWLEMRAVNTLTWLQSPLFNDLKCQLPMSNSSCVWDPSIELLFFSFKRLNITEMIHINSCNSMTYSGTPSSEYPYIVDFLNDQLEFVHQQGVQNIYNAKNRLSSQKYLQIWEMDIIFITFLPP